ncbi:MAG: phytanoyl-CoA dioxygenase family protein [Planctomycetota bacterium]
MPLPADQIEQFRTQGYALAEGFFDARETAAMQAEIQRLQDDGKLYNVKTQGDGTTASNDKANLQLCPMAPHSPLFKALPFEPKVIDAVTSLIGPEIILHLDQVFLKPGLRGTGTSWHQDNAYFQIQNPMQGTAMWIAVHDATVANGTMRILPAAFDTPLEHRRDPESNHHIRCYPDNELDSIAFEMPAGSVGFFCYGTPHCTMANNTTRDRAGVAFHFLTHEAAASSPQTEQFAADRDDRPALTGANATHGVAEYGTDMRGRYTEELERLLAGARPVGAA